MNLMEMDWNEERIPRKAKALQWTRDTNLDVLDTLKHFNIDAEASDQHNNGVILRNKTEGIIHTLRYGDWLIIGEDEKLRFYSDDTHTIMYHSKRNTTSTTINQLDQQVDGNHYKTMAVQPIEYIIANDIGFAEGNIIKYVSRWKNKNGITDLEKALHTLQLLIQLEFNKVNNKA